MVIFRKGEGTANFSLKDPDPINNKYFISADEFFTSRIQISVSVSIKPWTNIIDTTFRSLKIE